MDIKLPNEVEILDTTLRDGAQARGVNFTLQAKVRIALELDKLGVHFIEGGWPGSNPKDDEFFKVMKNYTLKNSELVAFTSTRRKHKKVEEDVIIKKVREAGTKWVTIFGKSWILHVNEVLRVEPEENLRMIYDTIKYFKEIGINVIFDAEHFFDGYLDNKDYAIKVLEVAQEAGADRLVLADTNGGMLPHQVFEIVRELSKRFEKPLGLHMHNDSGCAVANTIMGVLAGASHVHVTVNGIGERAGNADLCVVVPNLQLKLGVRALKREDSLSLLKSISELVYELSGMPKNPFQPYVGDNAFYHKAGVHVDAILKNPRAYEHIRPELVGNTRRLAVSELSGSANLVAWASKELKLNLSKKDPRVRRSLEKIKELEKEGYSFDNAQASALLILLKELNLFEKWFEVKDWRVVSEGNEEKSLSWSIVEVRAKGKDILMAGKGVGPVHAIEKALREAIVDIYPHLNRVKLIDYRVVLPGESKHTASIVRVEVTFSDGSDVWTTVAVSGNVIEASLKAIIDGFRYYLNKVNLHQILESTTSVNS